MIDAVTSATGEIVSLEEARNHLRIWDTAEDGRVVALLEAARGYCEEWAELSLRQTMTRTLKASAWPREGWRLRFPPVIAVSSVTYQDATDTTQTLPAGQYRVLPTREGYAAIEWTDAATFPALADRGDAVTVTYTTGWQSAAAAPAALKQAILLTLTHLETAGDPEAKPADAAKDAAMRLMIPFAAWSYR